MSARAPAALTGPLDLTVLGRHDGLQPRARRLRPADEQIREQRTRRSVCADDVFDSVDSGDSRTSAEVAKGQESGGDPLAQLLSLAGIDDPVALAAAKVEANLPVVVAGEDERPRPAPIHPGDARPRHDLAGQGGPERPRDPPAHLRGHGRTQTPERDAGRALGLDPAFDHGVEHLPEEVRSTRVLAHSERRVDDQVRVVRQCVQHPSERVVDAFVELAESALQNALRRRVERVLVQLGQVPELVSADMAREKREPDEIEGAFGEQADCGIRQSPRRSGEPAPEREQARHVRTAEHLLHVRSATPDQPVDRAPCSPRRSPGFEPEVVAELDARRDDAYRLWRQVPLVRIDHQRAPPGPRQPLPRRLRELERPAEANPLLLRRPLEEVVLRVRAELDPAVVRRLGRAGEVRGRGLERPPFPTLDQAGERR